MSFNGKWWRSALRRRKREFEESPPASRPAFNPSADKLALAPATDQFFKEPAVLDYISKRGFPVDSETGEVEGLHWSEHWQFRPLARKVKIRSTTRWPDPRSFTVMELAEVEGQRVEWGLTGAQRLRIHVDPETRKWLLDHLHEIDTPELLVRLIERFQSLEVFQNGSGFMISTRSGAPAAHFWNPEGFSPCVELLREGWFDFPLFKFEEEEPNGP